MELLIGKSVPQELYGQEGTAWKKSHPDSNNLPPLILIPGLTGSGLQDKLVAADVPLICPRNSDWSRLWIQPSKALLVPCFIAELEQTFTDNTFYNTQGVDIRTIDFGGVHGIDYLAYTSSGEPINSTDYMAPLIANLEAAGYVVGENLAGAPYDWRRTTDPENWNSDLKALIEQLYNQNGQTAVFILCHSMGNLEFASFMETMDQAWKDEFVAGFISAAAPWSGASLAIRALVSGIKVANVDQFTVASLIQTFGSVVWMVPTETLLGEQPVVRTNTTSYNYHQFPKLFEDIGAETAEAIFESLGASLENLPSPNVPTYCLYGTNTETEIFYDYGNGLDAQPTKIYYEKSGDGVVPSKV
eukprot:CAMPEP_0117062272 /NCGR_PEP_ID=MMETSP0472-20121206/43379_1 /TAXON_ID=693140 ORGANISM="Tiarina fusus, Strain LIS" /NCGR_SAMPLE_ID=MMETSP0472 /ASSEMBLY_ACC=CAM_ASM_000603 /LENGTH=358 /DNA_ID=CAMNT_0004781329 /DNA_START=76 /DNA_END=1153 /DNA_ORIENTATION=+